MSNTEITRLRAEIKRLISIIDALMYGYNSILEGNLKTQELSVLKADSPVLAKMGVGEKLQPYDKMLYEAKTMRNTVRFKEM